MPVKQGTIYYKALYNRPDYRSQPAQWGSACGISLISKLRSVFSLNGTLNVIPCSCGLRSVHSISPAFAFNTASRSAGLPVKTPAAFSTMSFELRPAFHAGLFHSTAVMTSWLFFNCIVAPVDRLPNGLAGSVNAQARPAKVFFIIDVFRGGGITEYFR